MADFERGVAYYGAHGLLLHLPAAEYYAAAYLGGQSAHGLDPRAETGLVLGLFGHEDGDAGYGVEWDIATRDYRLAVCGAEQLLDFSAHESVDYGGFAVHAENYAVYIALLNAVQDACDGVKVESLDQTDGGVGACGGVGGDFQGVLSHSLRCARVVVAHVEGEQAFRSYARAVAAHHQSEIRQRLGRYGVGEAYKGFSRCRGPGAGFFLALGGYALGGGFLLELAHFDFGGRSRCAYRGDGAGYENHEHRAVENGLVHHARAVGENHIVADGHNGQGHCGVGGGQAEHHRAVGGSHAVEPLGCQGSQPFACERYSQHDRCYEQRIAFHDNAQIDHHSHAYKEVGDEKGVSHEFDTVHQRRCGWNVAVEHQSGEESSEHRLKPDRSRYPG